MPRYYFIVKHDKETYPDDEGMKLEDIDAAWSEATRTCGEMVRAIDGSFKVGTEWSIEIRDEADKVLRAISVSTKGDQ